MIALLGTDKETPLLKQGRQLFGRLSPMQFPRMKGFVKNDLTLFEQVYKGMNAIERKYFIAFSGFIAREHFMAKTGIQGMDRLNGQASLWRDKQKDKLET